MDLIYKLKENLLNIAIGGINLISQDFKLKNNIEQLAIICENSPVLKKVYNLGLKLLQEENKISIYLDLLALIDAILTTQAKNINIENIQLIKTRSFQITNNLYSEIYTIKNLNLKSKNKVEKLKECLNSNNKILLDYRIVDLAIKNLGNKNFEVVYEIKENLKENGNEDLVYLLKEDFDLNGKREMLYRLEIIGEISKEKENDFYLYVFENAKKIIREDVIQYLGYNKENKKLLMELYESNKNYSKNYTIYALSLINDDEVKYFILKNFNLKIDNIFEFFNNKYKLKFLNNNSFTANIYGHYLYGFIEKNKYVFNKTNFFNKLYNSKIKELLQILSSKYSENLKNVYFKYLNENNIFLKLVLSELLLSNILISNDNNYINLALSLEKEDKEGYFLSSYFLANLLTKNPEEVYEKFNEKIFPKTNSKNNIKSFDKFETFSDLKIVYLQHFFFELNNNDNTIFKIKNVQNSVNIFISLDKRWFNVITSKDRLIYKNTFFQYNENSICFYYFYKFKEINNVINFFFKNNKSNEYIGNTFYNYIVNKHIIINLKFDDFVNTLKILNSCNLKNCKNLIENYFKVENKKLCILIGYGKECYNFKIFRQLFNENNKDNIFLCMKTEDFIQELNKSKKSMEKDENVLLEFNKYFGDLVGD